jgi:hypothetical protein
MSTPHRRVPIVLTLTAAAASGITANADVETISVSEAFHTAAVTTGDLDGDGQPDVIAAGYDEDAIAWFRRTESGWARHDVHQLDGAFAILAHDLDADGDPDLVAASRVNGKVLWYENRREQADGGTPGFIPRLLLQEEHAEPASVDAADVDGDGGTDVVVAFTYRPEIRVLLNPGGGGEGLGGLAISIAVPGNGVSWVRARDFDGDGDVDLVAATPWDWVAHLNYYWFRNDGPGGFAGPIPIAGGEHLHGAFAAAIADLDGDGRLDLATMSDWGQGNRTVNWFRRLDAAGEQWSEAITVDADFHGSDGTQSLHAADLDGDGRIDLMAGSSFLGPGLRVWWNRGPAVGMPAVFHRLELAPGFPAHGVTAADLDGDGAAEVIAGSWEFEGGRIRAWRVATPPDPPTPPCPGDLDGDATVGPADLMAALAAWGPGPDHPADLDGDGIVGITDLIAMLASWGPC